MDAPDPIGAAWLVVCYGINLVMPLAVQSRIGGRRKTELTAGNRTETFVESMRPSANLRGHLTFHLKHEVPHLEMLSRLFEQVDQNELVAWIEDQQDPMLAQLLGKLLAEALVELVGSGGCHQFASPVEIVR